MVCLHTATESEGEGSSDTASSLVSDEAIAIGSAIAAFIILVLFCVALTLVLVFICIIMRRWVIMNCVTQLTYCCTILPHMGREFESLVFASSTSFPIVRICTLRIASCIPVK